MDTDHCPKCDATTVVAGNMNLVSGGGIARFTPKGMRFFDLRGGLSWNMPPCGDFRACLTCGLVWSNLKLEELREYIDNHGTAETKLKLSPFRKAPPEQDLV